MEIVNEVGDLFTKMPKDKGVMICHVCNDIGVWGAGFVVPLGEKFPQAMNAYLAWAHEKYDADRNLLFALGQTQIVRCSEKVCVANMVAQHNLVSPTHPQPLRYSSLASCMASVAQAVKRLSCVSDFDWQICAPKFGAGLAGGDWKVIQQLINEIWIGSPLRSCPVTIYTLE